MHILPSGFGIADVMADGKCPDLKQKELRQLCRWEGLSKIPLLHIKAGSVVKDGVTLTNTRGTCGEGDEIKEFVTKNKNHLYKGTLTQKQSNKLEGICTYKVGGKIDEKGEQIGGDGIAFEVALPAEISGPIAEAKKPTTVKGFNYMNPQGTDVPIKKNSG